MRLMQIVITVASLSAGLFPCALADDEAAYGSEDNREVVRKVMGDDMPNFQSIWGLSSLSDEQREQLKGLMLNFQDEVKPLKDELASIRESALKGGSLTPEQMQEASQRILSGGMPSTSPAESKVLGRVQELRDQIKEKRSELWTQIKNVLTADQINQVQNF